MEFIDALPQLFELVLSGPQLFLTQKGQDAPHKTIGQDRSIQSADNLLTVFGRSARLARATVDCSEFIADLAPRTLSAVSWIVTEVVV
jgi:hypothetical protein